MAGFADPNTAHAHQLAPPTIARDSPSRPSLPSGPCNHRDATSGPCGCDQFWDKLSAELHNESAEHRPGSDRSTWCVCGHHACFHLRGSRAPEQHAPAAIAPFPAIQAICDGQCQLLPGVQCDIHNVSKLAQAQSALATHSAIHRSIEQGRDAPSQASTSGLPSIPSVCMLSRDHPSATDTEARHPVRQSRQTVAGLGLSMMQLESAVNLDRQQSASPTIPDDNSVAHAPQEPPNYLDIASTRTDSIAAEANQVSSFPHGILDQVLEFNRNLQLDMGGDTIPNTYNPDDWIQSATEVATPSIADTPGLGVADQAVQEGKNLIDTLTRLTSDMQQPSGSPGKPEGATSAPGSQRWLANSPAAPQEQIQQILRAYPTLLRFTISSIQYQMWPTQ
jgi:hypothetical protein